MSNTIGLPVELVRFELPPALQRRLQDLLDQRDAQGRLTPSEQSEAEALVELAEFLSLLKIRATSR